MDVRVFQLGPLATNGYLVSNDGKAVFIDPGGDPAPVLEALRGQGLDLTHILNTHLHFDHIHGNRDLAEATGAPILASPDDDFLLRTEIGGGGFMGLPKVPPFVYEPLAEGETEFAGLACRIMATPGHSPGSLSLYFPALGAVFSGDLLFQRSIGRTDFHGGDQDVLLDSVRSKIFTLPGETVVYSGHGEATTVADEMLHNPFLR